MLSLNDIKALYEKYDVSASKRFGQNFLIDGNVLKMIINIADVENKDVVEIGPGLGSLTHLLLKDAKSVTSYEIDKDMIRVLRGEIENPNFNLVEGDFLKQNLNWVNKKTLVANIPYYITSDILFKIFENADKFERAIIMMQDEVADRLSAKVGAKDYGKLTLTTKLFTENLKKEFKVNPSSFLPSPKVNSAVISFDLKKNDNSKTKELMDFFKKCFAQRRKTLSNNLKNIGYSKDVINNTLEKMELKPSIRPQELSFDDFINLYKNLI